MIGRILLIEDDPGLSLVLRDNLTLEGFEVACASTGTAALAAARVALPDVVLLDITLPDTDGFQLCGALRHLGRVAIIMLTARGEKADKLRGFDLGADDYITKPFDLQELLARVRAVLRRSRPSVPVVTLGSVIVDFIERHATRAGRAVHLTHREFAILQFLAERPNLIVSRDDLLREIWGYVDQPVTRSVDHAIARLRKKIERDPHYPRYIHTVHGGGYSLTPGGQHATP